MKLLSTGSDTLDMSSEIDIPLEGTTSSYVNTTDKAQRIRITAQISSITNGSTVTVKIKNGNTAIQARNIPNLGHTFTTDATTAQWQSEEIILGPSGGVDTLEVSMISDNGADSSVAVATQVYDANSVDIESAQGIDVVLSSGLLDVNAASVGGNSPAVPPTNWSSMAISAVGRILSGFTRNG